MAERLSGVRVRMAPGPTGPFHIGRSRTAVINWLFARHHGGTFVLRIEDTDQQRSKPEHLQSILESLRWLGLDWDEGPEVGGPHAPYFQMSRLDTYPPYVERLLASGHAYRCYCTREELDALRAQAQAERHPFRYPRTCRYLSPEEQAKRAGQPFTIRLAVAEAGRTGWHDMVLGDLSVENTELDDFIIMRSDGTPTYNFVVVIDDLTMEITDVIRGQDHVPNTPRQILIYEYLGEPVPRFAHVPLVVGMEDEKISARYGAKALAQWGREEGYLPDAILNYLATIGMTYEEGRDVFSREELVALFDFGNISRSRARMDGDKIDWFNGVYIRALPLDEFVRLSLPYLEEHGLVSTPPTEEETARARGALRLEQERVRKLSDTPEAVSFFLRRAIAYDPIFLVQKKSTLEEARTILDAAIRVIANLEEFGHAFLEQEFREMAGTLGLKTGVVFGTVRVAITGRSAAPPLFETMDVLGRDLVLERLHHGLALLAQLQHVE